MIAVVKGREGFPGAVILPCLYKGLVIWPDMSYTDRIIWNVGYSASRFKHLIHPECNSLRNIMLTQTSQTQLMNPFLCLFLLFF